MPDQAVPERAQNASPASKFLFDVSGIDRSRVVFTKEQVEEYIPHRGVMSMLDAVVYHNPEWTQAMGVRQVRQDEFWVPGHFPTKAMMPGVLMIETAAQLACFMFQKREVGPSLVAFLRIEEAAFRSSVAPGDLFTVLCTDVKAHKRRFVSDVQGLVGDRVAFDARICGMMIRE